MITDHLTVKRHDIKKPMTRTNTDLEPGFGTKTAWDASTY